MWRVKLLRFHQCIKIDGEVHIADAQYCLQVLVLLGERQKTWSCWCNANGIRLNSRVHRYNLSNSEIIFTAWQCKQGYLSRGTLSRKNDSSCVFVNAYPRFEDDCISKISSDLVRVWCAVLQKNKTFCGFSTSDVGLYFVQSGVGLRVTRRKQLKMCGISLKKLAVEPMKLSLKTPYVIVHVTCKLITPRTWFEQGSVWNYIQSCHLALFKICWV